MIVAPSNGGDILAWTREQIGYSESRRAAADFASGEAFHRGVVECLREVIAGLVPLAAERDALRARVAELEADQLWVPVTERLPDEGVDVLASRTRLDGSRHVSQRKWRLLPPWWVPYPEPTPLGVWVGGAWAPVDVADHWRPLPAFPEVSS